MFYYIAGKLALLSPAFAVVEAGGVGYKLTISQNTYDALPHGTGGETVKLYTWLSVREDGIELFGFCSEAELSTFKMLLGVSGVGPKVALSVLSLLTPEKFALAVCTDDKKAISKASGVGAKTAARIILELQDKFLKQASPEDTKAALSAGITGKATSQGKLSEAQDALTVLGYSRAEATAALAGIDTSSMELEDIVRAALKKLMK